MAARVVAAVLIALTTAPLRAADATPAPRPSPASPELLWELADGLERRLRAIETSYRARKPLAEPSVVVRERELNSYLNLTLASQLPPGVTELMVRIERDRVSARGMVDLDRLPVKQAAGGSAFNPINFLTGRVPVELRGRLTTEDGFGTFEPEDIRLATIPIPAAMVAQAVAQSTRSSANPQGFDILSPFRLPYGAKSVKLRPAKILLEF